MRLFNSSLVLSAIAFSISAADASTQNSIKFSEVRSDSLPPLTNTEYIELTGVAGASMDDLSIVVIGSFTNKGRAFSQNGGIVKKIIPLSGEIPADRTFVITDSNSFFEQPDMIQSTGLDDLQNLTLFLIKGEIGTYEGDDIDLEDDGLMDDWVNWDVIDSTAIYWQPVPPNGHGGPVYSENKVGPFGGLYIFGFRRCLDVENFSLFKLGNAYPSTNETPTELNPVCGGTVCPGDYNSDFAVNGADLAVFLGHWGEFDGPFDLDRDGVVQLGDLNFFLNQWGNVCD